MRRAAARAGSGPTTAGPALAALIADGPFFASYENMAGARPFRLF